MELLPLAIILALFLYFQFRKRPIVSVPIPSPIPSELAVVKHELHIAFQEMGQLQSQLKLLSNTNSAYANQIQQLQQSYDKVTSQKKSGEVRLGLVSEQVLPMLPEFPVPIHTLKFFGNPIDYISIDMDAEIISFIEVKSGGSALSDKQRKIRKMIQEKKVQFFEVRVDEKGIKVK